MRKLYSHELSIDPRGIGTCAHAKRWRLQPACRPRVLVLEPSLTREDALRFSFQQDLVNRLEGRYEAISYVWGKPDLVFPLYHVDDNSRILVTKNLDSALRRLRRRVDRRWLWADAACIKQSDLEEKAVQIPLMVEIFQGAKTVLAWLGKASAEQKQGMRFLVNLSRRPNSVMDLLKAEDAQTFEEASSMCSILNLPYFRRLWIMQEVVFKAEIELICGNRTISWFWFSWAISGIRKTKLWDHLLRKGCHLVAVGSILDLWKVKVMNTLDVPDPGPGILQLMETFSEHGCADPRDHIFALYNMASDLHPVAKHPRNIRADRIYMDIDYTRDVEQIYRAFASACTIASPQGALNAALCRVDSDPDQNLPSWVPDWRRPSRPSREKHVPEIYSFRTISKDVLHLQFKDLWPDKYPFSMAPGPETLACTCGHVPRDRPHLCVEPVQLSGSVTAFINAIIKTCQTNIPDDVKSSSALCSLLKHIWGIQHDAPLGSRLQDFVDYQFPLKDTKQEWEPDWSRAEFESEIRTAVADRCFFLAKLPGEPNLFAGWGNPSIKRGDEIIVGHDTMIMAHGSLFFKYGAVVIRPTGTIHVEERLENVAAHPDRTCHRLMGHACLFNIWSDATSKTVHSWWETRDY